MQAQQSALRGAGTKRDLAPLFSTRRHQWRAESRESAAAGPRANRNFDHGQARCQSMSCSGRHGAAAENAYKQQCTAPTRIENYGPLVAAVLCQADGVSRAGIGGFHALTASFAPRLKRLMA